MDKYLLREEAVKRLKTLTPGDISALSTQVIARLQTNIDWSEIKRVHIYRTAPQWSEVEIERLTSYIKIIYPDIEVVIPAIHARAAMPKGVFDLVIIPLLGYTSNGYRLGHGGGWYDRFLATQPNAKKIGVGFDVQEIESMPVDKHDIPLDLIITETRSIMSPTKNTL